MTTKRQREAKEVIVAVTEWMTSNPGHWWRIPDVANGTDLSVPAVNNALYSLCEQGVVIVDRSRRKKINGKRYPVYKFSCFSMPVELNNWLSPPAPKFTQEQIKGVRTVLGFTGDLRAKKVLDSL